MIYTNVRVLLLGGTAGKVFRQPDREQVAEGFEGYRKHDFAIFFLSVYFVMVIRETRFLDVARLLPLEISETRRAIGDKQLRV